MKKAIVLLLAVLYVTVTSGVVVNIHYCMGRIAEVDYGHSEDNHCGKCGMEQKDGCCTTENKVLKSSDEHLLGKPLQDFQPSMAALPIPQTAPLQALAASTHAFQGQYHSPPDRKLNLLRLFNGVFRI